MTRQAFDGDDEGHSFSSYADEATEISRRARGLEHYLFDCDCDGCKAQREQHVARAKELFG
jgi:hypothetical protein